MRDLFTDSRDDNRSQAPADPRHSLYQMRSRTIARALQKGDAGEFELSYPKAGLKHDPRCNENIGTLYAYGRGVELAREDIGDDKASALQKSINQKLVSCLKDIPPMDRPQVHGIPLRPVGSSHRHQEGLAHYHQATGLFIVGLKSQEKSPSSAPSLMTYDELMSAYETTDEWKD